MIERIIGYAGAGKTTAIIDRIASSGLGPEEIAVTSFTRAARGILCRRAAPHLGVSPWWLERKGHFRTAHSMAWRAIESDCSFAPLDEREIRDLLLKQSGVGLVTREQGLEAVIGAWAAARSANVPFKSMMRRVLTPVGERLRMMASYVVEQYELAKQRAGLLDHTDILGRFAGVGWNRDGTWRNAFAHGEPPRGLKLVIVDEAQDASALVYRVQQRLQEGVPRVIVAGDWHQSIFSFVGSSPRFFREWQGVTEETVLPKTWRCLDAVWSRALTPLRSTSGWVDHHVASAGGGGSVKKALSVPQGIRDFAALEGSCLALARTDHGLSEITKALDGASIPWNDARRDIPLQSRRDAFYAVYRLSTGEGVPGDLFRRALPSMPQRKLLTRGAKARWDAGDLDSLDFIHPQWLERAGFSERGCEAIRGGRWEDLLSDTPGFQRWNDTRKKHGADYATFSRVQVSTIHGAKGMEADNVFVSAESSALISKATSHNTPDHEEARDEEARIAYVAMSRARRNLIIARNGKAAHNGKEYE